MSVFRTLPVLSLLRILSALTLLLVTTNWISYAKGPEPPLRIPLETLGFQPPGAWALAAGNVLSTAQFIDDEHLLVTFAVHRLMKRLPDCPPDDQDRMIEAVLVHLPSGKVLARTQWRVHDGGQYLWNLGQGRFLLRIRDTLSTFAPMANLASGEPFVEQPFLTSKRLVVAVLLSPDRDLVTIETVVRAATAAGLSRTPSAFSRTQINFYRLLQPARPEDRVIVQAAGVAGSDEPGYISLTSTGHLEMLQEGSDRWLFDFDPYAGKYVELSPFETTCRPQPFFVSSTEFVAFGCRGGDDRQRLGGFDLGGEQMWQQEFTESQAFPNFAVAPAAGRFALSRNIVLSSSGMTSDFAPPTFTSQEIRVYQTYNGRQLLQVEASPVQRFGENYDLAPDGLRFAVIHGEDLEVYTLPGLTEADEVAIHREKALQPQDTKAMVSLAPHETSNSAVKAQAVAGAATQQTVAPVSSVTLKAPVAGPPASNEPAPEEKPRTRPTIFTLPTDKPEEFPKQEESPQ